MVNKTFQNTAVKGFIFSVDALAFIIKLHDLQCALIVLIYVMTLKQ